MPLLEQELLTLPEYRSSPPVFSGGCVTCACFVDRCLSFCPFSFGHCVVCSSIMYRFWLSLWYLKTLLSVLYLILVINWQKYHNVGTISKSNIKISDSTQIYDHSLFWLVTGSGADKTVLSPQISPLNDVIRSCKCFDAKWNWKEVHFRQLHIISL